MRVLLIGGGGREHALAWAITASPLLTELIAAPGNPGIATLAECVDVAATDIAGLVALARDRAVDLVVPGPEAPLVAGLADAMGAAGIACCGPSAAAAQLEGSKAFARAVCEEAGVPGPLWEAFTDLEAARDFVRRRGAPVVVKADGLAAGKGVTVAETVEQAVAAIEAAMAQGAFGEAGRTVLIEERLTGREVSLFALCDGTDAVLLGAARDHKRLGEEDTGPNTGGMGALAPPPDFDEAAQRRALDTIVRPVLAVMTAHGNPFRGILFAGLMLTDAGPAVIEFNVRLGDPEAQALLPCLATDLLTGLRAACEGELGAFAMRWRSLASLCVTVAAPGYPAQPATGLPIPGLAEAEAVPDAYVFHAGTAWRDGALVSSGGRILTVCGLGADLAAARAAAYAGVGCLRIPGALWRRDIGAADLPIKPAAPHLPSP